MDTSHCNNNNNYDIDDNNIDNYNSNYKNNKNDDDKITWWTQLARFCYVQHIECSNDFSSVVKSIIVLK